MLNIVAYIVYLSITFYITIVVGRVLHRDGKEFIPAMFTNDDKTAHAINNVLLAGYYLLNLGYTAIQVKNWVKVDTISQLIESVGDKAGWILLLLAGIHYSNLITFYIVHYFKQKSNPSTAVGTKH